MNFYYQICRNKLPDGLKNCEYFSAVDICDVSRLVIFMPAVNSQLEVHEELLCTVVPLKNNTTKGCE